MTSTRRVWIQQALTAAGAPLLAANPPTRKLGVDRLLERFTGAQWSQEHRIYRVDAAVTVLTSPMHWFRGIGHGFLALGETNDGNKATFLRFGATSIPAKASGFDRLGFIEEAASAEEFASFGFITGGYDGRVADTGYTAMDLYTHGRQCWFRRAGVATNGDLRGDLTKLIGAVRGALPGTAGDHLQVPLAGPHPTFLHALLRAVNQPAGEFRCNYVYNAKQFDLTVDRNGDERMAARLQEKGLTSRPDTIRRYDGTIRETTRQWSFRFWREDGTAARLPLRIEFQPKPMLRLSLELAPRPV